MKWTNLQMSMNFFSASSQSLYTLVAMEETVVRGELHFRLDLFALETVTDLCALIYDE